MLLEGDFKMKILNYIIIAFLLLSVTQNLYAFEGEISEQKNYNILKEAKDSLDRGDYKKAIVQLDKAIEDFDMLGDYILFWRAKAYEGTGDIDKAIADLKTIKEKYKDTSLIKNVRIKEVELFKKKDNLELAKLFDSFVMDYPSEFSIKYEYGLFLKENKEIEKAKKLFKEIYISTSSFSKAALNELSASDITVEDLIKRGENLNKAWFFSEAEKTFRDALQCLKTPKSELQTKIIEGLALSIFRQKRYKEAAALYKEIDDRYWRARALFRAGEINAFEAELAALTKKQDKRIVPILLSYGTKKRREGNLEKALEILNSTLSKYPTEKEDILWTIGWTYYLSGSYKKASEIFSQLYDAFGSSKYLYWKNRCLEFLDKTNIVKTSANKKILKHRDYYSYLSIIKEKDSDFKIIDLNLNFSKNQQSSLRIERVEILKGIGLNQEAISELIHFSKKNPEPNKLIHLSSYLKDLGNYKMSINLVSRVSYSEELHHLFYPSAFAAEVEDASKKNSIDTLLILSVIREESRFDAEARSIAGALGLMQLMPQTAQRFAKHVNVDLKNSNELYDPKTNILIGSNYLKNLITMFNSIPVAIAAYNAGEDAVRDWLKKFKYKTVDEFIEDIPYNETRNYVKRVLTTYFEYIKADQAKTNIPNLMSNMQL